MLEVGGQAVLGRQDASPTPWLTERHGYDPTCSLKLYHMQLLHCTQQIQRCQYGTNTFFVAALLRSSAIPRSTAVRCYISVGLNTLFNILQRSYAIRYSTTVRCQTSVGLNTLLVTVLSVRMLFKSLALLC